MSNASQPILHWEGRRRMEDEREALLSRPPLDFPPRLVFKPGEGSGRVYHGDNLEVMRHLLEQPERLAMIYADPPFMAGRRFDEVRRRNLDGTSTTIRIPAYDDRWRGGETEFLNMVFPRLILMRELLVGNGIICLHIDTRLSGMMRLLLDEVFGRGQFINEIIWSYGQGGASPDRFIAKHDTILVYSKGPGHHFDPAGARAPYTPHAHDKRAKNYGGKMGVDDDGRAYVEKWGTGRKKIYRYYLDEGKACPDVWTDIPSIQSAAKERSGYPTQKPVALLRRLILAFTKPTDMIGDFFCGSGTTAIAANESNRRWIVADASPVSKVHTRRRLLQEEVPFEEYQGTAIPPGQEEGPMDHFLHLRRRGESPWEEIIAWRPAEGAAGLSTAARPDLERITAVDVFGGESAVVEISSVD